MRNYPITISFSQKEYTIPVVISFFSYYIFLLFFNVENNFGSRQDEISERSHITLI